MKFTKNKKGIFFTLLSVIFVSILVISIDTKIPVFDSQDPTLLRINNLNTLISQIEDSYMPLALRSATMQAIEETIHRMNASSTFLPDPATNLAGVIHNGSYEDGGIITIRTNTTLDNFTIELENSTMNIFNVDLNITVHRVELYEVDHFTLAVAANFSLEMKSEVGNWTRINKSTVALVSIEGFLDPYLLSQTGGIYDSRIHATKIGTKRWNISNVVAFIGSGNYTFIDGIDSPSFLQRFETAPGTSACCGILSFINPDRLRNLSLTVDRPRVYSDFLLYEMADVTCPGPQDLYTIDPAAVTYPAEYAEFKLNFQYATLFNVSTLIDPVCP